MTEKNRDQDELKQAAEQLQKNQKKIMADAERMASALRLQQASRQRR